MIGQISIFDRISVAGLIKAGDVIQDDSVVGARLSWDEACERIGQLILYKQVLQSATYYTAVIPEKHLVKTQVYYRNNERHLSDRLVCYHGTKSRMLIDELCIRDKYEYPGSCGFYAIAEPEEEVEE